MSEQQAEPRSVPQCGSQGGRPCVAESRQERDPRGGRPSGEGPARVRTLKAASPGRSWRAPRGPEGCGWKAMCGKPRRGPTGFCVGNDGGRGATRWVCPVQGEHSGGCHRCRGQDTGTADRSGMGWGLWPLFSSKRLVIPHLRLGGPAQQTRPSPANQTGLGTRGQLAKRHRLEVTPAPAQSRWGREGFDSHEGDLGVTPA